MPEHPFKKRKTDAFKQQPYEQSTPTTTEQTPEHDVWSTSQTEALDEYR